MSGDIVLRAAKRGVSAGEMLGLVMSRYLIHSEFKALSSAAPQAFTVFFLLDDYAGWLAQKENQHRKNDSRKTENVKRRPPAVFLPDVAAKKRRQPCAESDSHRINTGRRGAF